MSSVVPQLEVDRKREGDVLLYDAMTGTKGWENNVDEN